MDGLTVMVEGSVGVAYSPDHARDAAGLFRSAAAALAQAAAAGTGTGVFHLRRDATAPHRLQVLGELRDGLANGQLRVHYQPKLDLTTGRVDSLEALVRWQHTERGLLQPGAFLSAAEGSSLMRRLTDDVLRMALDDCRRWRSEGRTWSVAVNLSARCLVDPSLPHDINTTVRRAGLTPDALQLEVTESAVMADPDRALAILGRLCDLGYELALDDFGTGHSSLAYLHRLPVTWLKVDRSFVGPMGTDPAAATIMRSTLALARSLRVRTVAEGVEQSGDLGTLRRLGCTAAQGHGLSPAVPVGQVPGAVARIEHRARGRLAPGSPVAYATVG